MQVNLNEIMSFSTAIEELVEEKDISYIDAVVMHCEKTGMEVELAAKLLSQTVVSKIQTEAEDLHYIPKSNTIKLPI
jgi:Tfp pilus assembly pilus retraction ATPase PilT